MRTSASGRPWLPQKLLVILLSLAMIGCAGLFFCRSAVLTFGGGAYDLSDSGSIPHADFVIAPFTGNDSLHIGPRMSHRLDAAAALYESGLADAVIVTGNGGEADLSAEYLIAAGIPAGDILLDRGGINLYSSIWRISRAYPDSSLLFCIQEKYIPRSDYIAAGLGAKLECVAADVGEYEYLWFEHLREVLSAAKAVLEAGMLRPSPLISLEASPIVAYLDAPAKG